jgi:hypothetical protein
MIGLAEMFDCARFHARAPGFARLLSMDLADDPCAGSFISLSYLQEHESIGIEPGRGSS